MVASLGRISEGMRRKGRYGDWEDWEKGEDGEGEGEGEGLSSLGKISKQKNLVHVR